jgi:hypothetical protein
MSFGMLYNEDVSSFPSFDCMWISLVTRAKLIMAPAGGCHCSGGIPEVSTKESYVLDTFELGLKRINVLGNGKRYMGI